MMEKCKKYGKRFLIGCVIGLAVWGSMSLLGAASLLPFAFAAPNPMANFIYATLFFGTINIASAVFNDCFDGKKEPMAKDALTASRQKSPEAEPAQEKARERPDSFRERLLNEQAVSNSSLSR
jgi:hypothetical protein